MAAVPPALESLVRELSKLPGVGEKTATRLAFHLLRTPRRDVELLAEALLRARKEIHFCSVCMGLTDTDPCPLCVDPRRSDDEICVVERPADLIALERSGLFRGRYHVLHGCLAPLDGIGPEQLKVQALLERLADGTVREVILATNPTVEGEATALYLARLIKPFNVRATRIARGLPVGGDVEYTDTITLGRALEGRRDL